MSHNRYNNNYYYIYKEQGTMFVWVSGKKSY